VGAVYVTMVMIVAMAMAVVMIVIAVRAMHVGLLRHLYYSGIRPAGVSSPVLCRERL
jgi:hypothetical protein